MVFCFFLLVVFFSVAPNSHEVTVPLTPVLRLACFSIGSFSTNPHNHLPLVGGLETGGGDSVTQRKTHVSLAPKGPRLSEALNPNPYTSL